MVELTPKSELEESNFSPSQYDSLGSLEPSIDYASDIWGRTAANKNLLRTMPQILFDIPQKDLLSHPHSIGSSDSEGGPFRSNRELARGRKRQHIVIVLVGLCLANPTPNPVGPDNSGPALDFLSDTKTPQEEERAHFELSILPRSHYQERRAPLNSAHNLPNLKPMAMPSLELDSRYEEKPKLLLLQPINGPFKTALSQKFELVKADESPLPLPTFLSTHCLQIKALLILAPIVTVDSSLLDQLPSLGLVAATSAGVNHIHLDACRKRGVAVTNAGETFTPDVADFAVGLLVDVLRKVTMADRFVKNGLWMGKGDLPLGSRVSGKRVGIVGLGSIGSHVAKRLMAFGCPISYFSRAPKPNFPSYKYFSSVLDLACENDVLVLSCALTAETHNIINRDVMVALGKDGIIINVGRGALIDEPELVRCLKEGVIGGAGLDVFVNEPDVPKELFQMENVVLSDHRAVTTPESFKGVFELVIANLDAFFSGKPLLSPVSS